ncbi:MAG TPA: hypothetical protein VMF64_02760 [Steroidobacteraceae bacterium]|nr:hypothetical protein [Steroidobacteraceae bacterium]
MNRVVGFAAIAVLWAASASLLWAQPVDRSGQSQAASAETQAPVDLTGYWVSIVGSNGWLFRMVVPQRGQYAGIPINGRARAFADAWSAAADEAAHKQCEAYGAAAIMQIPERLHVSWQDPQTLQIQTDAGMQSRLLRFQPTQAQRMAAPSRQGNSVAQWMLYRPGGAGRDSGAPRYGWLQVITTHMLPGLLRKNGVPYSAQASMTESWQYISVPDGEQLLTLTTTLTDPVYLAAPYLFNSVFQKQRDDSGWMPSPCSLEELSQ